MESPISDIAKFVKRWKLTAPEHPKFDQDLVLRYQRFFAEELQHELSQTSELETEREKLTHTVDCLTDALVFILQLANFLGIAPVMKLAWDEVHRSNCTKGDSKTGILADSTGKWIKGPQYSRPQLDWLFQNGVIVNYQKEHSVVAAKLALLLNRFPSVKVEFEEGSFTAQDSDPNSTFLPAFMANEAKGFGMILKEYKPEVEGGAKEFVLEEDENIAKLDAYQGWLKRVAQYPAGLVYTTAGLSSEAGEVLGVVQKVMRRLTAVQVSATDLGHKARERLLDELSDVLFYLVATSNELGISIEQLAEVNREKIEARIANGTVYATN